MKQVVKAAQQAQKKHKRPGIKSRVVAPAVVKYWGGRIRAIQAEIDAVLEMERTEKSLRKAEMEANKAHNLLQHEEEIARRPARTWFQSESEKRATKARSKDRLTLDDATKPTGKTQRPNWGGRRRSCRNC